MKPIKLFYVLLIAAFLLSACGAGGGSDTIKIGLLAPLSGAVPTFGISTQEGAELAIKEWNEKGGINGKQLELVVADSQCSADPAVNAVNKLIDQDKVSFVVGEVCSSASIPVSQITNEKKVLQISPTSTNPAVTVDQDGNVKPYTFRACYDDNFQGVVMAKFAMEKGLKTAFITYDQGNDYTVGLANSFESAWTSMGGTIGGKETYTKNDTDFSAILTKVAEAKPDVLWVGDYYNIVNLIGAQAKDKGVTAALMGGDGWDSSDLDVAAAEGGFYSNHYDPADSRAIVQDWITKYGAAYKNDQGEPKVPDALATLAYDATNMLLSAIQNAQSEDVDKVAAALAALQFDGVSGSISFDEKHNPVKAAVVIAVENGNKTYTTTINP